MAYANELTTVKSIDENRITLNAHDALKAGSVVYIVKQYDRVHETVMKRCDVLKEENEFVAKCEDFHFIVQPSISQIVPKIEVGATAYINLFAKRSMIIAPNQVRYLEVQNHFNRMDTKASFVHPDFFALKLLDDTNPLPEVEDFNRFCQEEVVENLLITFEDKVTIVNCFDFTIIDEIMLKSKNSDEFSAPFYHRIDEIEWSFFELRSGKVENFNTYYMNLIKEK